MVKVLGATTLECEVGEQAITSRAMRSLLASLALRAGSPVPVHVLAGWVWGEEDDLPEHPVPALQTVVSRLRSTMRTAEVPATLATVSGGYVLQIRRDQVDALRFESLIDRGRELARRGQPEQALEALDAALALWSSGQALIDVTQSRAALSEAVRLGELRLGALDDRMELLLGLRPAHDLLAELALLTSRYPLREAFARQYMIALDACGRRADALEVYRRLAHAMHDELGVGPGTATRATHARLLTERPAPALAQSGETSPAANGDTPATTPAVSWPVRVGAPPALAAAFQVRTQLRARLDAALAEGAVVVTQVLAGDGGVGKTQLATAILHDALDDGDVDLGVWVTATSRDAVLAGYAAAYSIVHPPAAAGRQTVEERAAAFLAWLADTDRPWMIVLDDVADPADLNQLRPHGSAGRVLVTTRRRDAAMTAMGTVFDVGLFDPEESVAYLYERLSQPHVAPTMLAGAEQLVADLGHLPLALAQAAAVIINDAISCADYRALLADRTLGLAEVFPADPRASGDDYAHALPAAWSLATDRAAAEDPLVKAMLALVAVLDPNGIPEVVLLTPSVSDYLGADYAADGPRRARSVIRAAHRFSLLTHTPADPIRSIRMHALAQRAVLDRLADDELARVVLAAADALLTVFPRQADSAELGQVMKANTRVLAERRPETLLLPHSHPVILRAAVDLGQTAQVRAHVEYFAHLVSHRSASLGADHPSTLHARFSLGDARVFAGDFLAAVRDFEDTLAAQLKVLGPEHRDTLATRHLLGDARGEAGDALTASRELESLASTCIRVLGPDEPLSLAVRIDGAYWRGEGGDSMGASRALEELLPETIHSGGADSLGTLFVRHYLARTRERLGDPAGAVHDLTALLEDVHRVAGPATRIALKIRLSIAHARGRAGTPGSALADLEALLEDALRVLGLDHPQTLEIRSELAFWRGENGDVARALEGYRSLLADLLQLFGPEHPLAKKTRDALAEWESGAAPSAARSGVVDLSGASSAVTSV